mmetsp:Transcript_32313/g.58642  ORF Transcript_32313/g.58642 Transcript_32313/m.58642 type:complete len:441 (-) Transcript_32313:159-1481(-)
MRSVVFLVLPCVATAAKWAVIAAGSKGFYNYRHQADACHAYQLMRKSGIPEENVILMMQDDVANSTENPFPGKLFNQPGDSPPDVYAGCKIDYKGDIVTAELFMKVLTGNGSGKVLKSGPEDEVFINFVDHGGAGLIAFPNGPVLSVKDLSTTLKTMKTKKMFKQLLFYMEACESGSMFPDLTSDGKILAVTAANGEESSWGTYCGEQAKVKGKNIGSCLGDLFSVSWMQDSDQGKFTSETISTQLSRVKNLTNKSHVMYFGDRSFENEPIGQLENALSSPEPPVDPSSNAVDVRDIYVTQAVWAWQAAAPGSDAKALAWKKMMAVIADRDSDEQFFEKMVNKACEGVNLHECHKKFLTERMELKDVDCHDDLVKTLFAECPTSDIHHSPGGWNGFNMKFAQVMVNFCEGQGILGKSNEDLVNLVKSECRVARAAETLLV